MKYLLVPLLALGVGTAAIAASPDARAASGGYPACSKSVTDECTEAARPAKAVTGAKHAHKSAHHRHHRTSAKSG